MAKKTAGWTVCMVGFARAIEQTDDDSSADIRAAHIWSAAASRLCTDWFGMKPVWELGLHPNPNILMVTPEGTEELIAWLSRQTSESKSALMQIPVIMVCQNAAAALYMAEHSPLVSQVKTVEFISQP